MDKVFLYARRSNKKNQDRAISIEKQLEAMRLYCHSYWYEIVEEFYETQSGFKEWIRKEYGRMIESVKDRNLSGKWERVDKIIVYIASRLCRNQAEAHEIVSLVESEHIIVESITESFNTDSGVKWKKHLVDALTLAAYESKEKSTEGKKNMDITYSRWEIAWVVPYWYSKVSKKSILVNDDEANIVREVFKLYSTWKYSYEKIKDYLNEAGYTKKRVIKDKDKYGVVSIVGTDQTSPFKINDIENILKKWFYCWRIQVKYKKLTSEELRYFQGRYPELMIPDKIKEVTIDYTRIIKAYEPYKFIITDALFEKCSKIRSWHDKKTKEEDPSNEVDESKIHPWRWILKCNCQAAKDPELTPYQLLSFTSEKKKWKYIYYRCSGISRGICEPKETINQKEVEKLLEDILKKIVFTENEIKQFSEMFTLMLTKNKKTKEEALSEIQGDINLKKSALMSLVKEYRSSSIDLVRGQIEEDMKKGQKELDALELKLKHESEKEDDEIAKIDEFIEILQDLRGSLDKVKPSKKQRILNSIFKYVVIWKWKLVSYKLDPFIDLIVRLRSKSSTSISWTNEFETTKVEPKEIWTESQEDFPLLGVTLEGSPTRNRT